MKQLSLILHLIALFCLAPAWAQAAGKSDDSQLDQVIPTLWIEEMTAPEIQAAIKQGYTNIIIPTAGIEQNGAHMPLNKHQMVVRKTAMEIAQTLGNTLIAPIIDFVPEGNIENREGNMYFAGTISMPHKVFADIIDYTARSLHRNGFKQILLIGDSGGNQQAQYAVAKSLRNDDIATYHIGDYYAVKEQVALLKKHGFDDKSIGGQAGMRETSEFMAVAPHQVRESKLGVLPETDLQVNGSWGDTTKANAGLGRLLLDVKVQAAIQQICEDVKDTPPGCDNRKD